MEEVLRDVAFDDSPYRRSELYNGCNVAFRPRQMSGEELRASHRALWRRTFSPAHAVKCTVRGARYLRSGPLMMATTMNGFYGWKRPLGNEPMDARASSPQPQAALRVVESVG